MNASARRLLDSLKTLADRLDLIRQRENVETLDTSIRWHVGDLQASLSEVTDRFAQWAESGEPDVDDLTARVEGIGKLARIALTLESGVLHGVLREIEEQLSDATGRIDEVLTGGRSGDFRETLRGGPPVSVTRGHEDAKAPAAPVRMLGRRGTPRTKRYANVELRNPESDLRLDQKSPLKPGQIFLLRLSIGELTEASQVRRREAFPDDKLPKDIDLDVMVSSTDFGVGAFAGPTPAATAAHGRLFLPGDGGPATTPDGADHLVFRLRAPDREGSARSRIGYYYRNILVQSQLLSADVGKSGSFTIDTDFTLSEDLASLHVVPERPRLSVLTNSNGNGTHQIVLRLPGANPGEAQKAETYGVNEETVGEIVGKLRSALAERAPTTKQRRRPELEADLKAFAPHGWKLYGLLPGQRTHMFDPLLDDPEAYVVQVLRPTSSSFTVPWALFYDIPLLTDKPEMCPLVTTWDGQAPLFKGSPRQCPHGPHTENVLCPFGFWGFRYAIEQLSSTDKVDVAIEAREPFPFVVAQTQYGVDLKALEAHAGALRATLANSFPGATLEEGKDKATIRTLLGRDLPFVYFYCHGERQNLADPDTFLGVGKREALPALEFKGWIVAWQRGKRKVWDKVRPLVFVNACHSLAIYPDTFMSYLDAFVTTAHAAGVIGTEVKVHQGLAMDVAQQFFGLLLSKQHSVESALRAVRLDYLAAGNLFGLVYTPYCWSELKVA